MPISEAHIRNLVEEKLADTSMFIVELTVGSSNKIKIELDSLDGVNIDDCVGVSRHVEHQLDRDETDFELQVSSAGIDKPLRDKRQYTKNVGREIKVRTLSGDELKGKLVSATEEIKLELPANKKKKLPVREATVAWEEIAETKVIISFK
ncbi:MAG: ribosome assembly cofactor RimP [Flavobacteriales bacterium]|jgi:ribosome maturation factor RimP|nr:ribosome assembly cofactor RimP [Flavobacteriales bacterium]NCG30906.1 ribosome assembly cofactor RimP [Bacteroidota bacterium]MBT3962768.1 ribosome assembly cofactor RimP [Flavobacteriales bacterium]MBT4704567.1 ribosome assembly cofactor RimP [Flavobacteriales bacterium]MBT4929549.1 ribosome assembly cofactor RimP [Flavobacteriales bacterium]